MRVLLIKLVVRNSSITVQDGEIAIKTDIYWLSTGNKRETGLDRERNRVEIGIYIHDRKIYPRLKTFSNTPEGLATISVIM